MFEKWYNWKRHQEFMNTFIYLYVVSELFEKSFGCFRAFVWSLLPWKAYLLSLKNVSLETHSTYFTCHNKAKRHELATFQDKHKPMHIKKNFYSGKNSLVKWSFISFAIITNERRLSFFSFFLFSFFLQKCIIVLFLCHGYTAQQTPI